MRKRVLATVLFHHAINAAIGHESAAGGSFSGAELEVTPNVRPAQRRGLRDRPDVQAVGRLHGEVIDGTPEVASGVVLHPRGVRPDVAGDGDVIWQFPQTRDVRVEADGHIGFVAPRFGEKCVAAGTELRPLLFLEDGLNPLLRVGTSRLKDQHALRLGGSGAGRSSGGELKAECKGD